MLLIALILNLLILRLYWETFIYHGSTIEVLTLFFLYNSHIIGSCFPIFPCRFRSFPASYVRSLITKLIDEDKEYTNIEDIMTIQKKFYETLYTSHDCKIQDNHLRDFFNRNNPYLNFLDTEESESLEGLISKSECLAALRNMKNGKSPGLDGYTAEFYKFFWSDLHPFLLNSLNYAYHTGLFSITQR